METSENRRWSDKELEAFRAEFENFRRDFRDHLVRFEVHAREEQMLTHQLLRAFPNDDPAAHRQYHDGVLEALREQANFWRELRVDVAKKSVWGLLVLFSGLLFSSLALKFGLKLVP